VRKNTTTPKQMVMHVFVCDDEGVAYQCRIAQSTESEAEVQLGFLDNIDGVSAAAILLVAAHACLKTPHGSDALAHEAMELLMQAQSIVKVRMMRDETQRTSRNRKGAASGSSSIDDDSEIPF